MCSKRGREQDQPWLQPSAALGSSPHPSLQTCTPLPSPQPTLGALLPVSQFLAVAMFVLQLAGVVVMSLMETAVLRGNASCTEGPFESRLWAARPSQELVP